MLGTASLTSYSTPSPSCTTAFLCSSALINQTSSTRYTTSVYSTVSINQSNLLTLLHNSCLWHCINLSNLLNLLQNGDSFFHLKLNTLSFLHNSFSLQLCINQSKGGCFHQENQECGRSFKLEAAGSEATRRNFFSNRVVEAWNMVPGVIKKIKTSEKF
jgi:hypothetical protein